MENQVTVDIVRQAVMGAAIRNYGELYASYGGIPQQCIDAARIISDNYAEFEKLVWKQLSSLPMIHRFCGHLIRKRLRQKGILISPIISAIFDEQHSLEQRLNNIRSIPGVDELQKEYRGSNHPDLGDVTDEAIVDFGAEILTLDFLSRLGFSNVRKMTKVSNEAHLDITAERDGKCYAVEVTRKREIRGWQTLPYGNLEDCNAPANQDRIRKLILHALVSKENQFVRTMDANTIDNTVIRVVAIRTSDYGFAECIDQAEQIARGLLAEPENWEHVDCMWLISNSAVEESRWLCKKAIGAVSLSIAA